MAKKKPESNFINMVLTLFIVASVAGAVLALVYVSTKGQIAAQKIQKVNNAVKDVFPTIDKVKELNTTNDKMQIAESLTDITFDDVKIRSFAVASKPKSSTYYKQSGGGDSLYFYDVFNAGTYMGTAVKTFTMTGFSGKVTIMVGFDTEGNIRGTSLLEHKETPGLGDKMDIAKHHFPANFWNKKAEELLTNGKFQVSKDGGEIDAITAATISSRAFCDAVQLAYDTYKKEGGPQ